MSRQRNPPPSHFQRGATLMIMLVIMVLGAATFLVGSLGKVGNSLKYKKATETSDALMLAKAALIGYALTQSNRPGQLPCPDTHAAGSVNAGVADTLSGNNCSGGNLGRLPWKTLKLPDLRDAAGEPLWYAVADPYHAGASAALNSETNGTLSLSGNVTSAGLLAIIFAPGQALPEQNRITANFNSYSHFLESVLTAPASFQILSQNDYPNGAYTYNDQVQWITRDDIMPAVEKIVLKQFKDSGFFSTYYDTWSAFPFAAPFADPSEADNYNGTNGTVYGLLPLAKQIGGTASTPYWTSVSSPTPSAVCSLRSGTNICSTNCNNVRCSFSGLTAGATVTITGTISNIGKGFWRLYDPGAGSVISTSCVQEVCARSSLTGNYYPASDMLNNTSIAGILNNANGSATITFTGIVKSSSNFPNRISFSTGGIPNYPLPAWLSSNNWQQVMYYAVSPGYTPGGNHSCSPVCISLDGNTASAVVVATGDALANQTHPSNLLSDYLEGNNATPALGVYANKTLANNFNDKAISIAP